MQTATGSPSSRVFSNAPVFTVRTIASVLGAVLLISAAAKAMDPAATHESLGDFTAALGAGAPSGALTIAVVTLVGAEVLIGLTMLVYPLHRAVALGGVLMFACFSAYIVILARLSPESDCGCGLADSSAGDTTVLAKSFVFTSLAALYGVGAWVLSPSNKEKLDAQI